MSATPNTELVEALLNAQHVFDWKEHIEKKIEVLQQHLPHDSFELRAVNYSRQNYTTAAILAFDPVLREEARNAGIDVREFDNIVGQVQQFILAKTTRPIPGVKVVNVLKKLTGL